MLKDLEILLEMQKLDDIIGEKEILSESLPHELSSLKHNVESANQQLHDIRLRLEENLKNQKLKELKIKENNEKIGKYKNQLLTIKTNKEYKALNSEISHLETSNVEIDDEIIDLMEKEVEIRENQQETEYLQKQAEEKLKANQERLQRKLEEVQKDINVLRNKRNNLAEELPKPLIKRYAALIKNKQRKAVVFKLNEVCGGCGYHIRPQMIIEINEGNHIVYCENCGRIIVNKAEES